MTQSTILGRLNLADPCLDASVRTRVPLVFSTMSAATAARLISWFQQISVRSLEVGGVTLVGRWQGRRFVIAQISPSECPIEQPIPDLDDLILQVPLNIECQRLLAACRQFGLRVEQILRAQIYPLEAELSLMDGCAHTLHAYNHLAFCGHSGPWERDAVTNLRRVPYCQQCNRLAEVVM